MHKKILFGLLCLLSAVSSAIAQGRTVTGKVTADGGELPGVTVVVKGTGSGTATDVSGHYSIDVPARGATLVFSFVGMATQEVAIGNRTTVDVALKPDAKALSEVVVVGYGTQAKADLTGSIARITGKEIENLPISSIEQGLQGRTPGVYINTGSGKLGQGVQIRVRGSASVSASNQPLYVVDGIPVTSQDLSTTTDEPTNPIADIDPNDIASFEILKDAAAAAIYGSRASNGVVLITTKKGKAGKTKINFGYFTGTSTPTRRREWLNASEYFQLFDEAIVNSKPLLEKWGYQVSTPEGIAEVYKEEAGLDRNSTVDQNWADEAFQTGGISQYNVSASGGDEKTRFYISGTYNDQKGILVGNAFNRATGRINLDHTVSNKLKIGTNLSLIRSVNNRVPNDNAFSNPLQLNALPPIQPKLDPETGKLNNNTLYYNNLIELANGFNIGTTYRTISNIFASYNFLPSLTFRSEYGLDLLQLEEEIFRGRDTETGSSGGGYGYNSQIRALNYTTNNTLSYDKTFAEQHHVNAVVGFAYQQGQTNTAFVEGRGFPDDRFKKIASAARITGGGSSASGFTLVSYLARVNYKFANKYLLGASGRVDGSSRFGANNRYGFFPSVSAGYVLSEESFLQALPAISFLKVRASYGLTGNSEITNFASRGLYNAIFYADQAGITPSSLPNPDLTWENTTQADVGVDFGLAGNRISGELDFYLKNTDDLLLNVPLPATNGYTSTLQNVGSLMNKGFEFVLNTDNLTGAFQWRTSFNVSRNINEVTKLHVAPIEGGGRNIGRVSQGEPLGYFYTVKYAGVDPENGDALYFLENGQTTNDYTKASRQKVGNPNPDYIGGLDNRFSFKGFDLNVLLQGVFGNDLYNTAGYYQSVNADYFDNQSKDQLNRWQKPGDITDVPQARLYGANGNGASSRWVQDGSFVRVKTVNLGYNLPADLVKRARLQHVRIYAAAQNLFTFTKYNGYDPEVNTINDGLSNINLGHDFYTPPQAKTLTLGVNIGL